MLQFDFRFIEHNLSGAHYCHWTATCATTLRGITKTWLSNAIHMSVDELKTAGMNLSSAPYVDDAARSLFDSYQCDSHVLFHIIFKNWFELYFSVEQFEWREVSAMTS